MCASELHVPKLYGPRLPIKYFFYLLFFKFGAATPKLHKHIAKRNTDAIKKVIANILAPIEFVEHAGSSKKELKS